jgi:geranylgeranyl reductase
MDMEKYDAIIVGAGPAGLKCAEILAEGGKKVVVLEKNKIIGDKICAGGLTLKALELGIPDKIIQKKFKRWIIHTPLQDVKLKSKQPFMATVDRKGLGKWMAEKAREAGAEIRVSSVAIKIDKNFVTINNKEKIKYKYLVGADGTNSIVRKYLGTKTEYVGQAFYYLAPKKFKDLEIFINPEKFSTYLWVFPYKDFTSIGTGRRIGDLNKKGKTVFGLSTREIKKNLDKFCENKFDVEKAKFRAAMVNFDYRGYEFGNKFLIGDAAGFASGLTGEGIYFAIKSGEDVAKKIIDKKYFCENIRHILRLKKWQERIAWTLEINKTFTKFCWGAMCLLLKSRWISNKVIKEML